MEGISHEAASFAGTQKLGKLIVVYDDNGISIDGKVSGWFADNTAQRFEAYGWHVAAPRRRPGQRCGRGGARRGARGHRSTVADLRQDRDRLGRSQQAGHRSPCMARRWATRKLPPRGFAWAGASPPFEIPADIRAAWDMREKGARVEQEWRASFAAYKSEFPALAAELERRMAGDLPSGFDELVNACIKQAQAEGKSLATRQSSQATLERARARRCPNCSAAPPISRPRTAPCARIRPRSMPRRPRATTCISGSANSACRRCSTASPRTAASSPTAARS